MALASASAFPSICLAAISLLDSAFALFSLTTISTSQYVRSNSPSSHVLLFARVIRLLSPPLLLLLPAANSTPQHTHSSFSLFSCSHPQPYLLTVCVLQLTPFHLPTLAPRSCLIPSNALPAALASAALVLPTTSFLLHQISPWLHSTPPPSLTSFLRQLARSSIPIHPACTP